MASDKSDLIEGAHADYILYVFDESKEIPVDTWDSAEGAFSTGNCYWLAISTPGEPAGRFYDIQSRKAGFEDWYVRHITLQEALKARRLNEKWVADRRKQWGEKSAAFINRVEGNFASSDEDGVIPLRWIELANDRHVEFMERLKALEIKPPYKSIGCDIARGGEDKTVFAPRIENTVTELRRSNYADTMITVGLIIGFLDAHGGRAIIDVIGIGAGVVDRCREIKNSKKRPWEVVAFGAAEHTDRTDASGEMHFSNKRSAAWWNMREMLDPDNGYEVGLPYDDNLTGDLTSVHWKVLSGGRIQVEAKEDIKERIGRSTDDGDAVVMAFYDEEQPSAGEWIKALKKRVEKPGTQTT
jgi:hypothetical protein